MDTANATPDSPHTAWRKGYNASGRGLGLGDNPYRKGTKLYQAWRDGWFDNDYDSILPLEHRGKNLGE